jgi:hypothetical protein
MNQPDLRRSYSPRIAWDKIFLLGILGVFLLIGGLALVGPTFTSSLPMVACVVEADPTIPGRAYAQFEYLEVSSCSEAFTAPYGSNPILYETDDYGETWHENGSMQDWKAWHSFQNVPGLTAGANQLWYTGRSILAIPHQLSQVFAFPNDSMGSPDGLISSAAPPGQGVLYAAMGEYGLLVGPNPAEAVDRPWQWIQGSKVSTFPPPYIAGLSSNIVGHPAENGALIVCAMTLPLVFLAHSWLIEQVWRYMYSPDERYTARFLARLVAVVVSGLYVAIIAFWKADAYANFFVLVGVFALCAVALSVAIGVRVARRRHFTDAFVQRMGIVTGLLSLIVPAVVAATPTQLSWPLIVALILGFIVYRRALSRYLDRFEARTTLWQIDRLTLEIEGLFVVLLVPMGILSALVLASPNSGGISLVALIAVPSIAAAAMWFYTKWRGRNFVLKKKASPLELHDTPLFGENRWFAALLGRTVLWLVASAGVWLVLAFPHIVVQVNILFTSIFSHDL